MAGLIKFDSVTTSDKVHTIFVNRNIPDTAIALLVNNSCRVIVWNGEELLSNSEISECLKECDAFLSTGSIHIDKEFITVNKHLKIIAQASAGYNNIDLETAKQWDVAVANAPNTMNRATADISFLLMLAVSRKMGFMTDKVKNGAWQDFKFTEFLGQELHGKTLGVFGLGNIGYEMARLCKSAYNMKVVYHNRSVNSKAEQELNATYVSFEELLQQSDVVSVHCNLTEETKGIFNAAAFARMKPTSIFINVARGGVHDEAALIKALQTNIIWGAGLDVTNPEPMLPDNPLLTMENVVVTPHIGSATTTARQAMAELAAQNIIDFFTGKPIASRIV